LTSQLTGWSVCGVAGKPALVTGYLAGRRKYMYFEVSMTYNTRARSEEAAKQKALKVAEQTLSVKKLDDPLVSPSSVYKRLKFMSKCNKEIFIALALTTRSHIIKKEVISVGTLNASLIHPREVFQFAIMNNAAGIIIAHNHPSGISDPSDEDIHATHRLMEAGRLMGIDLLDHIIIGKDQFTSLKEMDLL
jgi:DNA repair protein RadC